jgi:hypothetical protein
MQPLDPFLRGWMAWAGVRVAVIVAIAAAAWALLS